MGNKVSDCFPTFGMQDQCSPIFCQCDFKDYCQKFPALQSPDYLWTSRVPRSTNTSVTDLLIGILEPQEGHFLSPEGARMQDCALKISKNFMALYLRPMTPSFTHGSPKNNALECITSRHFHVKPKFFWEGLLPHIPPTLSAL